jgi:hypothetical protein
MERYDVGMAMENEVAALAHNDVTVRQEQPSPP